MDFDFYFLDVGFCLEFGFCLMVFLFLGWSVLLFNFCVLLGIICC